VRPLGDAKVPDVLLRSASLARVLRRWLCVTSLPLAACSSPASGSPVPALVRDVPVATRNLALAFDGVDDYATTGTAQFPSGRGTQTISVWFRLDDAAGKRALITLRKDRDSGVELALVNGVLGAYRVLGNRLLLRAPKPVSVGAWHHAAYTFDTITNQIYIDGTLAASVTSLPDERTPTTCWLGTLDGANDLFNGSIDDFRVFNLVRTPAQIAAEAAGNFSGQDPGLVLELPCNEESGDIVFDHSPVGNDGDLGDGFDPRKPARVPSGAPLDL